MFKKIEDKLDALSHRRAKSLHIHKLQFDSDEYPFPRSGMIRVGIPSVIGTALFPQLIRTFCSRYPQYELSIVEEGTSTLVKLLREGKLDIGFVVLFGDEPELELMTVATGQMMVCLPPNHRLAELPAIPMSELRDEQLLMLKKGTYIRKMIIDQCEKNQFTPNIVFSTSQLQTILRLVNEGVGITFLLDYVAQSQPEIICKPLVDPILVSTGLAWPKNHNMSEATEALVSVIKEVFSDISPATK